MFDADGNQMVDKREFLVVSVKSQNKNIDVFLFFFYFACTHINQFNWWIMNNYENSSRSSVIFHVVYLNVEAVLLL